MMFHSKLLLCLFFLFLYCIDKYINQSVNQKLYSCMYFQTNENAIQSALQVMENMVQKQV